MMPAYLRANHLTARRENVWSRYWRQFDDPIIWHQGSTIDDYDEHLSGVIDQASCMTRVRGADYVDRQISALLSTLDYPSEIGYGDPLHMDAHNEGNELSERQMNTITAELAGLLPLGRDAGQPSVKIVPVVQPPVRAKTPAIVRDREDPDEWLTPKRAAFERGVSERTVYRWFKVGMLPLDQNGEMRVQRWIVMSTEVKMRGRRKRAA